MGAMSRDPLKEQELGKVIRPMLSVIKFPPPKQTLLKIFFLKKNKKIGKKKTGSTCLQQGYIRSLRF